MATASKTPGIEEGAVYSGPIEQYTYFIQAGENGPIKIGSSNNPELRLMDLQVGNHEELRLLAKVPAEMYPEKEMQETFAPWLIRGEWFRPEYELMKTINEFNQDRYPRQQVLKVFSWVKVEDATWLDRHLAQVATTMHEWNEDGTFRKVGYIQTFEDPVEALRFMEQYQSVFGGTPLEDL